MRARSWRAVPLALAAVLAACGGATVPDNSSFPPAPPRRRLVDVPDAALARLSGRVMLFGHQSVGANLLQGIREWGQRDPRVPRRIQGLREAGAAAIGGGALLTTTIGTNGQPGRKTDDFVAALASPAGRQATLALHKYCYLDFEPATDPARVFADYRAQVERVRAARPDLVLVHVTVPVRAREPWYKTLLKRLLRRTTADDLNVKRAAYNALVLDAYRGKEPVFDLAGYESTGPDGRRVGVLRDGKAVPALAPAWTDDGSHLNAEGRRMLAEQFLVFLAGLP